MAYLESILESEERGRESKLPCTHTHTYTHTRVQAAQHNRQWKAAQGRTERPRMEKCARVKTHRQKGEKQQKTDRLAAPYEMILKRVEVGSNEQIQQLIHQVHDRSQYQDAGHERRHNRRPTYEPARVRSPAARILRGRCARRGSC